MKKYNTPQSDDLGYRDYLLEVIDQAITINRELVYDNMETTVVTHYLSANEVRKQTLKDLKERFFQAFDTQDNTVVNVNKIGNEVLKALLKKLGYEAPSKNSTQTEYQYQEDLIGFSGKTPESIAATLHIDLLRPVEETTSRINVNIRTLQNYLRNEKIESYDGKQGLKRSERKPFFLYQDEWRAKMANEAANKPNAIFFPEIYYEVKTGLFVSPSDREWANNFITAMSQHFQTKDVHLEYLTRVKKLLELDSNLLKAHREFAIGEYGYAAQIYQLVQTAANELSGELVCKFLNNDLIIGSAEKLEEVLVNYKYNGNAGQAPIEFPATTIPGMKHYTAARKAAKVRNAAELAIFEGFNVVGFDPPTAIVNYIHWLSLLVMSEEHLDSVKDGLYKLHDDLFNLLPHVMSFMLPICQGDVALKVGDFAGAAQAYALISVERLQRGSLSTVFPNDPKPQGDLPWTWFEGPFGNFPSVGRNYSFLNKDCEQPYLLARLGDLYLTWAGDLFRTGREAETQRALELYRAVLLQYGIDPLPKAGLVNTPAVAAAMPPNGIAHQVGKTRFPKNLRAASSVNPMGGVTNTTAASTHVLMDRFKGHKNRIKAAFDRVKEEMAYMDTPTRVFWEPLLANGISPQELTEPVPNFTKSFLENGLVITGYLPISSPVALAQQMRAKVGITLIEEGLNYFGYPDNFVPAVQFKTLLKSAQYFAALASKVQSSLFTYRTQIENIEFSSKELQMALIAACKRVEIESNHLIQAQDAIFNTLRNIQHIKDAIAAKQAEIESHDDCGEQLIDAAGSIYDFATKGFGLGGIFGGMVGAAVGAGKSMSGMANAANQRLADLKNLNLDLNAVKALLDACERETVIAESQQVIATLEVITIKDLIQYHASKKINLTTLVEMTRTMEPLLQRYLDSGMQTGWLAERVLSFAEGKDFHFIRFDHFAAGSASLIRADMLESELNALQSEYLASLGQRVPIKWTVSLQRDFPLEFGKLLKTGKCFFATQSATLEVTWPGTYNHRIRSVEVKALTNSNPFVLYGMLRNFGVSRITNLAIGAERVVIRAPEMLPVGEPGVATVANSEDALVPFEGFGFDSIWRLDFPAMSKGVSDIEITFHIEARFSELRKAEIEKIGLPTQLRTMLFSAAKLDKGTLDHWLQHPEFEELTFVTNNMFPSGETDRKLMNVGLYFQGVQDTQVAIKGTLQYEGHMRSACKFTTTRNVAHSNNLVPPAQLKVASSPLNAIITDIDPEQKWKLVVANNTKFDRSQLTDVVLGIEYSYKPVLTAS